MLKIEKARPSIGYNWIHSVAAFRQFSTPQSQALKIGADPSRDPMLAAHCKHLMVVDVCENRIPSGVKNATYLVGDWQALAAVLPRNSIDIAVSDHVIEHVPDDIKAFNQLYEVLSPRGMAIIGTPNRRRLVRRVVEAFTGPKHFPTGTTAQDHVREYDWKDIHETIAKTAFKRFEVIPIGLGIMGGPLHVYLTKVPGSLRNWAGHWEIRLYKQ